MGGEIGVESAPDQGSTFWFTVPLADEAANGAAGARPMMPDLVLPPGAAPVILYIEDNLGNLKLVERIVARQEGFRLLAATAGLPGLELARDHHPSLILLDLHLPDVEGKEVLARLRADPQTAEIPVIVTSADPRAVTMQHLGNQPVEGYLSKPIEIVEFIATVNQILNEPK
jgi:CheY-like chemotaxis protein